MPAQRRASWQASLHAPARHEASATRAASAWPGSTGTANATHCTGSSVPAGGGEDITRSSDAPRRPARPGRDAQPGGHVPQAGADGVRRHHSRRAAAPFASPRPPAAPPPTRSRGSELCRGRMRPRADHPFIGVCGPACRCCPGGSAAECFVQDLAATPAAADSDDCHTWHRHVLLGAPGCLCPIALPPHYAGPCGRTFGRQVWVTAGFLWLAGRPGMAHLLGPWRCLRWLGARISGPWARWCARPG
jgi:hypothetical protein